MAQKTEKEETEFKVPESLTLCVNNCGVTGNPATNNMCQKCFNASTSTSTTSAVTTAPNTNTSTTATTTKSSDSLSGGVIFTFSSEKLPRSRSQVKDSTPDGKQKLQVTDRGERSEDPATAVKRVVNRCSGCRRKVGLTGFRCRCGELFCWEHRYSDRHDCSYDYKAAGREAITRENPVVKAAKIVKV